MKNRHLKRAISILLILIFIITNGGAALADEIKISVKSSISSDKKLVNTNKEYNHLNNSLNPIKNDCINNIDNVHESYINAKESCCMNEEDKLQEQENENSNDKLEHKVIKKIDHDGIEKKPIPDMVAKILRKNKKYDELTKDEKKEILNFFKLGDGILVECNKNGYLLKESINIATLAGTSTFSVNEIEQLIIMYNDILKLYDEIIDYELIIKKFDKLEQNKIKALFLKGYKIGEIKSAYIVSKALDVDLEKIIKKDHGSNNSYQLNDINNNEDKKEINNLINKYFIDVNEILNIKEQKNMSLIEIQEKINEVESQENSNNFSSLNSESNSEFNKYFNAPFTISNNNNEEINLCNGSLIYKRNDYALSGRNGFDLNIGIKYDSSLSNMYKEIYNTDYYISYYAVYAQKVSTLVERDDYGKENILEIKFGENKLIGNYNTMREAEDAFNRYNELYSGILLIPGLENQFYEITYNGTIKEYYKSYRYNDILPDTYEEVHNNFGTGWSLSFSSIEIDNGNQYLHLPDGRVYKYVPTSITDDSNLDKYTLKDIKLEADKGSYSNGQKTSSYVLIYKNGNKEYFADDGRLLAIQDKYDNMSLST